MDYADLIDLQKQLEEAVKRCEDTLWKPELRLEVENFVSRQREALYWLDILAQRFYKENC